MAEPLSGAIEPIAVVTDYRDLVVALRQRIVELGTHITAVGEVAGLPSGYTARDRLPPRGTSGPKLDDAKGEAWYGA
jgi:hypothetical protein